MGYYSSKNCIDYEFCINSRFYFITPSKRYTDVNLDNILERYSKQKCENTTTLCQISFPYYFLLILSKNSKQTNNVRMAERSKAPDSRYSLLADSKSVREFWSSYEGVGSNPTSDKITFFA